jgi:hypothetical protein
MNAQLIPLSKQTGASVQRAIHQGTRKPGMILYSDGRSREWKWHGLSEKEGKLYAKGDELEIEAAVNLIRSDKTVERKIVWNLGKDLFKAFTYLEKSENRITLDALYGIYFISGGKGVLILPSALREIIKADSNLEDASLPVAGLSEKSAALMDSSEKAAFYTASCLYRLFTGKNPFPAEPHTSPWERCELTGPVHPASIAPDLDGKIADALDQILNLPKLLQGKGKQNSRALESAKSCAGSFPSLLNQGYPHSPVPLQKETIVPLEEKRYRPLRHRIFLRRNRKQITFLFLTATIVALLGSFLGNLFFRALPTDGLPPEEVVYLFYDARNRLDHETIDAALARSAGSGLVNELTSLYVIYRVRQGYEQKDLFIPADRWFAEGAPEPQDGALVYGAAGISIAVEQIGEVESSFTATAILVFPDNEGEETDTAITYRKERLHLLQGRKRWEITSIEVMENRPLEKEAALELLQ